MTPSLPEYYFRVRENGAVVFRVDTANKMRRIEMDQIAVVNVKNGEIKPHGQHELTAEERARIADWLADRQQVLAARQIEDIQRTIDHLNLTTTWAQQKASPDQINQVADALLLAMHDLRSVLVRKKSAQLSDTKDAAE